eukprot:Clim_evm7s32 gene=Clim_evmTU7s32
MISPEDEQDVHAEFENVDSRVKTGHRKGRRRRNNQVGRPRRGALSLMQQDMMGKANMQYVDGKLSEAAELAKSIVQENPHAQEPYQLLSTIFEELGDVRQAFNFALTAAYLQRTDPELWSKSGFFALELGDQEKALMCFGRCLKWNAKRVQKRESAGGSLHLVYSKSDNTDVLWEIIRIYMALGDDDNAKKYLDRLLRREPSSLDARMEMANLLYRQGDYQEAHWILRQGVDVSTNTLSLEQVAVYFQLCIAAECYRCILPLARRLFGFTLGPTFAEQVMKEKLPIDLELHITIALLHCEPGMASDGVKLAQQVLTCIPVSPYADLYSIVAKALHTFNSVNTSGSGPALEATRPDSVNLERTLWKALSKVNAGEVPAEVRPDQLVTKCKAFYLYCLSKGSQPSSQNGEDLVQEMELCIADLTGRNLLETDGGAECINWLLERYLERIEFLQAARVLHYGSGTWEDQATDIRQLSEDLSPWTIAQLIRPSLSSFSHIHSVALQLLEAVPNIMTDIDKLAQVADGLTLCVVPHLIRLAIAGSKTRNEIRAFSGLFPLVDEANLADGKDSLRELEQSDQELMHGLEVLIGLLWFRDMYDELETLINAAQIAFKRSEPFGHKLLSLQSFKSILSTRAGSKIALPEKSISLSDTDESYWYALDLRALKDSSMRPDPKMSLQYAKPLGLRKYHQLLYLYHNSTRCPGGSSNDACESLTLLMSSLLQRKTEYKQDGDQDETAMEVMMALLAIHFLVNNGSTSGH